MKQVLCAVMALVLAGCGTTIPQNVSVAVPVECRVQTPARPPMPTAALSPGVSLDRFAASATAEIELREGYEIELRAALDACTAPIAPF